jgi:hypothetical protein
VKQRNVVMEREEELVKKLGGRKEFDRARATLDSVADARSYLNAKRNLGNLYVMMSEVEGCPDAVLVAENKLVFN